MINNSSRDFGRCRSQLAITAAGGKRVRSQSQNKIEYLPNAKIGDHFMNIIPNETWDHILKISGVSDKNLIETCKSWQFFIENDYELKNIEKKYSNWDSSQLTRTLTPKMIYVSNKIFYELLVRHRNLVLSSNTRQQLPKEFEKFDKICKALSEDSFTSKRDHIFKSVVSLLKKHEYNGFKALQVVKNGQQALLIKIQDLIYSEKDNQNYKILYNHILGINPDRVHKFYADISEKYSFLNAIKNTGTLRELINTKDKTAVQFRKIVELKEWPFRQDLKMAALETLKEGQYLSDAASYFQDYSNNNYGMTCSEIIEISPAFLKSGKLKELAQLCTHFAYMNLYTSIGEFRTLIDLCRQAHQFEEAANLGIKMLNNKKMHPTIDEHKKIAQDCFNALMFNDAANISINIINVTQLATREEQLMLIEALTKAGRFDEIAKYS